MWQLAPQGFGAFGEMSGILQAFQSLASPPPPAPYFSHSLAVSFPSGAFLKTQARDK